MSVINQVLIDLEKRRASGSERGAIPDHVRALPEGERALNWGWIATGGIAAVAALAVSGALISGVDVSRPRAAAPLAPAPLRGPDVAAARIAAVTADVTADVPPRGAREGAAYSDGPASRLSMELSTAPAPLPQQPATPPRLESGVPAPLPTARVLGRKDSEPAARNTSPVTADSPSAGRTEATKPAVVASTRPAAGAAPARPEIQKQERQLTPRELADNEYRKATASLHQGRSAEAEEGFQAALNLNSGHHGARQALVGLLVGARKFGEAERVLQEGVKLAPAQAGFAMTLARLQVDRGDNAQATATLQRGLEHAQGNADYVAFLATLLQRQGRHDEAIDQFQGALRMKPAAGVWWLGLGISLQAANRTTEAQEAYRRARATNSLNPDLAAFAEQRIRQLQ